MTIRSKRGVALFSSLALAATIAVTTPAVRASTTPQEQRQPKDSDRIQQRLEREVRHELVMLPYFSVFDNLAFKVDGDNVTLLGEVTRPSLKSDAEGAVKRIEGVTTVVNQIEVLPPSPNDDRIRWAAYRAIYGDPMLQRYSVGIQQPIHIVVKNGHLTLEGVVSTEGEKNVANIRANGVSGVFSVNNNLRTESGK
ncbi:MAG: BON domain-containing protein [Acidipila sp.]|nr:BON domain-containing protein [Acidipila sp.]